MSLKWIAWFGFFVVSMLGVTLQAQDDSVLENPPITVENVGQLQQIARLGNGAFTDAVAYHPGRDQLVVGGRLGLWIYQGLDLATEPEFIDLDHWASSPSFSSDGRYLAYTSNAGATVLDADTHEVLLTIPTASRILFRPGTSEAVVAVYIEAVENAAEQFYYPPQLEFQLWDIAEREQRVSFTVLNMRGMWFGMTQMEFSADGRYFATALATFPEDTCDLYSSWINVWDVEHPDTPISSLAESAAFAFHPTEPIIVAAYHSNIGIGSNWLNMLNYVEGSVAVVDMPEIYLARPDGTRTTIDHAISRIDFNEQGSEFIVTDAYDQAYRWEYGAAPPTNSFTLDKITGELVDRVPLAGSDLWLTVTTDRIALSLPGSEPIAIADLPMSFRHVAFSPNSDGFTSLNADGETQVWQLREGQAYLLATMPAVRTVMGGSTVVMATNDEIRAVNFSTGIEILRLPIDSPVLALTLNSSGTQMAYRTATTLAWWDVAQNIQRHNLSEWMAERRLALEGIQRIEFVPNTDILRVSAEHGLRHEDRLYLLRGDHELRNQSPISGYSSETRVVFSPQQDRLFLTRPVGRSFMESLYLTDIFRLTNGFVYESTIQGFVSDFLSNTVLYSEQRGGSFDEGAELTFWTLPEDDSRVYEPELQGTISYGGASYNSAGGNRLSPDGRRLLIFTGSVSRCGGDYNTMSLWDTTTLTPIIEAQSISLYHATTFDPTTALLVYAGSGSLTIYDSDTGAYLLTPPNGHRGNITGLQFNSLGTVLLSSADDGTVRLWGITE